jgi:hypothetical protein
MIPVRIAECAQTNHLGTFEKRYSEASLSLVAACFLSLFFGGGAISLIIGWLWSINGVYAPLWAVLILVPVYIGFVLLFWNLYFTTRKRWLYLYRNGFVYDDQGHIQGYHLHDILSVDVTHIVTNGSVASQYRITFRSGKGLQLLHGAEVKSLVERSRLRSQDESAG